MKLFTVIGARPQFIKAAVVSQALKGKTDMIEVIVHTGQHFDKNMSDIFFDEMEIPKPDFHLDVHGLNHGAMTGRMMEGLEKLMIQEKPDLVLVYGDTNSTLAGALTAKKLHIRVAHVEAGLRSFNMKMPEEVNRILTDRISDLLYCPTITAKNNLLKEGYENIDAKLLVCGDVMYDAALFYAKKSSVISKMVSQLQLKDFVLCTLHRAENTDVKENLNSICSALNEIHENTPVVIPMHPRTKKMMEQFGIELKAKVVDPVGYFDMISLIQHSKLVMTDSGGLQKEAYFFKKPCVTMRDQTEWVELIETGANVLVGADSHKIVSMTTQFMSKSIDFSKELYGNGHAAEVIVNDIRNHFSAHA